MRSPGITCFSRLQVGGAYFSSKDIDPIRFKSLPPNKKKTVTITRPFPSQHVGSVLAEGSFEQNATALIQKVCIQILSDPPKRNIRNIYDIPFHYTPFFKNGLSHSMILVDYTHGIYGIRLVKTPMGYYNSSFQVVPLSALQKNVCVCV